MTFPAVPLANQWNDNELVNAALMNQRIDQNLNKLAAQQTAASAGVDGIVFIGAQTGSGTVGNNSWTAITPTTSWLDPLGCWSGSGASFTPKVAGWWAVFTTIAWAGQATPMGIRGVDCWINGTQQLAPGQASQVQPATTTSIQTATGWFKFNGTTDTATLMAFQSSGGALAWSSMSIKARYLHA